MNRLSTSMPAKKIALAGSSLSCGLDIKVGKIVHEVNIDAKTGAVVEDTIDAGND